MTILKRPLCWQTRHHWLLQNTIATSFYQENLKGRDYIYEYQCQRCGKWESQDVINLDNAPKEYHDL